jgi:uncharacterized membrane protein
MTWITPLLAGTSAPTTFAPPIIRLGPFSIDVWALVAFAFLGLAIGVPFISAQLKLTTLAPAQVVMVVVIAFVATFWQELVKMARYRGPGKERKQIRIFHYFVSFTFFI